MADVQAHCGNCHKPFRVAAEQVGLEVRCPHCRTIVVVPSKAVHATESAGAGQGSAAGPVREIADALRGRSPTSPAQEIAAALREPPVAAGHAAEPEPFPGAPRGVASAGHHAPAGRPVAGGHSGAAGHAGAGHGLGGPAAFGHGVGPAAFGRPGGNANPALRVRQDGYIRPRSLGTGAIAIWIAILAVILVGAVILGSIAFSRMGNTPATETAKNASSSTPTFSSQAASPRTNPDEDSAASIRRGKKGGLLGAMVTPTSSAAADVGEEVAVASGTGSAATATGKASPTKSGAKPAPAAVEVMTTPEKNPKGIQFSDMKMFSGYKGGMATYVACRLTNGTGQKLPVVRVTIDGKDAGDKSVGTATVTLYNVPPGETVPVVAEWDHDEGAKAARWTAPVADVNPPGEPQDMPTLVASEAWPMKDSNSQSSTGRVKTTVTNKGLLTLPVVDMSAILVGEDGSIVGVAKGVVPKEVKPNVASDVTLPWDRTNGDLVKRAEVWVQAYR